MLFPIKIIENRKDLSKYIVLSGLSKGIYKRDEINFFIFKIMN